MSDELETACVEKIEELCRKKCEEISEDKFKEKYDICFARNLNDLACFISIMVIAIGFVFLLLFLRGRIPTEIKVEETVEYSTNSYVYPYYPNYAQFYKNRFPYKHTTKNSAAAFITFIICASCVLAIAIFCVAMLAINANKSELTRKKLCALKYGCDKVEPYLSDENTKLRQTYDGVQTEYYPKNKAAADIFKAYANAIAEL